MDRLSVSCVSRSSGVSRLPTTVNGTKGERSERVLQESSCREFLSHVYPENAQTTSWQDLEGHLSPLPSRQRQNATNSAN